MRSNMIIKNLIYIWLSLQSIYKSKFSISYKSRRDKKCHDRERILRTPCFIFAARPSNNMKTLHIFSYCIYMIYIWLHATPDFKILYQPTIYLHPKNFPYIDKDKRKIKNIVKWASITTSQVHSPMGKSWTKFSTENTSSLQKVFSVTTQGVLLEDLRKPVRTWKH